MNLNHEEREREVVQMLETTVFMQNLISGLLQITQTYTPPAGFVKFYLSPIGVPIVCGLSFQSFEK